MDLMYSLSRMQWLKRLVQLGRSTVPAVEWCFERDAGGWAGQLYTPQAEQAAGIGRKIAWLQTLGPVTVLGGLTTGVGDALFRTPWPQARQQLASYKARVPEGGFLLLYVPHAFWSPVLAGYDWLPSWQELYADFDADLEWTVFQYSTAFDAAGRYFFIARKCRRQATLAPAAQLARRTFRVFFHPGGADLSQGNSSKALSAHLCRALVGAGAGVSSHSYLDEDAVDAAAEDDVLIGHVGPWVKQAYQHGLRRIVLFNPANRWYPTRHLEQIEANATIAEQVHFSQLVIAQSGEIWRTGEVYPDAHKWRWINLGVDRDRFPRGKHSFNPPGRRTFACVHLYDDHQKGADLLEALAQTCPREHFTWIGGRRPQGGNIRFYPPMPNTGERFRKLLSQCDFLLIPSREDAQPGTFVEGAALGLLPVATLTSGYSLSFPRLVLENTPAEWAGLLALLQELPEEELLRARGLLDVYLQCMHDWATIESQIVFYLRELESGLIRPPEVQP